MIICLTKTITNSCLQLIKKFYVNAFGSEIVYFVSLHGHGETFQVLSDFKVVDGLKSAKAENNA